MPQDSIHFLFEGRCLGPYFFGTSEARLATETRLELNPVLPGLERPPRLVRSSEKYEPLLQEKCNSALSRLVRPY